MKLNNDGTATNQEHYKKAAMQPIEVMQRLFTKEQFLGFLMGNYIKYEMRKDYKNSQEQDENKARQYAYWYTLAKKDIMIEPLKDSVPNEFHFEGLI